MHPAHLLQAGECAIRGLKVLPYRRAYQLITLTIEIKSNEDPGQMLRKVFFNHLPGRATAGFIRPRDNHYRVRYFSNGWLRAKSGQ
jgi:hypothetical protein